MLNITFGKNIRHCHCVELYYTTKQKCYKIKGQYLFIEKNGKLLFIKMIYL